MLDQFPQVGSVDIDGPDVGPDAARASAVVSHEKGDGPPVGKERQRGWGAASRETSDRTDPLVVGVERDQPVAIRAHEADVWLRCGAERNRWKLGIARRRSVDILEQVELTGAERGDENGGR